MTDNAGYRPTDDSALRWEDCHCAKCGEPDKKCKCVARPERLIPSKDWGIDRCLSFLRSFGGAHEDWIIEIEALQRNLDLRNEQIDGYERQLGIDNAGVEHTIGSEIERLQSAHSEHIKEIEAITQQRDDYKADYLRVHKAWVDLKHPDTVTHPETRAHQIPVRPELCIGKAHIPIATCATCGCFVGSVDDLPKPPTAKAGEQPMTLGRLVIETARGTVKERTVTGKELEEIRANMARYFKGPLEFREPQTDTEGPVIYDANGNQVAMLYWPCHPVEETAAAEQATYELGRAMAAAIALNGAGG